MDLFNFIYKTNMHAMCFTRMEYRVSINSKHFISKTKQCISLNRNKKLFHPLIDFFIILIFQLLQQMLNICKSMLDLENFLDFVSCHQK